MFEFAGMIYGPRWVKLRERIQTIADWAGVTVNKLNRDTSFITQYVFFHVEGTEHDCEKFKWAIKAIVDTEKEIV